MAASQIVPLTITYTAPSATVATTATVVGQVLNNGGTNWVPTGTSDQAIYLFTSGTGASTVVQGTTYYVSDGPALPAQVTLSSISTSGSGSASRTSGSTAAMTSSTATGSSTRSSSSSSSQSATAASSTSSAAGAHATPMSVKKVLGAGLAFVGIAGAVWI